MGAVGRIIFLPHHFSGRIARGAPALVGRLSLWHKKASFSPGRAASSSSSVWERSAHRVKNTSVEKDNPYLDLIRDTHDPSLHLKTLEDELKGTIGKALGKQGEKIQYYVRLMQQVFEDEDFVENNKRARKFNEYRKQAIQARWELTVHRQAAGFLVNNHTYVMKHYPIPEALPESETDDDLSSVKQNTATSKTKTKQFGDQLDWWQRIGRWR